MRLKLMKGTCLDGEKGREKEKKWMGLEGEKRKARLWWEKMEPVNGGDPQTTLNLFQGVCMNGLDKLESES